MSEDDYLKDDISNSRRRGRKLKVKDVYSDTSESESDDNHSGTEKDGLKGAQVDQDVGNDSDSDMFASDNEEDTKPIEGDSERKSIDGLKKSKKEPRKLDMEKFEEEYEIDTNNVEEPELEAFDLRQEQEEGYFDEDGNFIRKDSDKELETEHWTDLDKAEIERARNAKQKHEQKLRSKNKNQIIEPLVELLTKLIHLLEPDETPMEALRRYAPAKSSKRKSHKNKDDDPDRKKAVMELTDICDKLMIHKQILDTYDMVREEFMRLYKSETGEELKLNRGTKRRLDLEDEQKVWQFRWEDLDEVHGPYTEYEMSYWKHNYFDNQVEVRKVGDPQFIHVSEVEFNDYD